MLNAIIQHLVLDSLDTEKLQLLAAETRHKSVLPDYLIDYVNNNEYILDTIQIAKEYNAPKDIWLDFINRII